MFCGREVTSAEEYSAGDTFLNEKIQCGSNTGSLNIYVDTEPKKSILIPNFKFNKQKQCTNGLKQSEDFLKANKQQNADYYDPNRWIKHTIAALQVKILD